MLASTPSRSRPLGSPPSSGAQFPFSLPIEATYGLSRSRRVIIVTNGAACRLRLNGPRRPPARRGKGGDESWNITSEGWLYTESERNTVLTVTTTLWCKYSCNRHTSVNYSFSVKNIKCVYAHESEYIGCQKSLTVDEVVFKFPLKVMKTGPFSVRHVRVLGNGWLMQREGGLRNAGNPCL